MRQEHLSQNGLVLLRILLHCVELENFIKEFIEDLKLGLRKWLQACISQYLVVISFLASLTARPTGLASSTTHFN